MGTDIHVAIEKRRHRSAYEPSIVAQMERHAPGWAPPWDTLVTEIELSRDYYLFNLLAGQAASRMDQDYGLYPPRGFPLDADWKTRRWYEQCNGFVYRPQTAPPEAGSDAHTPSWLLLYELRRVWQRFAATPLECAETFRSPAGQEIVIPEGWTWRERDRYDLKEETVVIATRSLPRRDAPRLQVRALSDLEALLAYMDVYAEQGHDLRLVFFFDN